MKNIFKNKKRLLIILIVVIFIIFLLYVLFLKNDGSIISSVDVDSNKIMNEYEVLNNTYVVDEIEYPKVDISNNKFDYTDINEIINIFNNNGDAVIFFGYASCLYCRTAIQILHDTSVNTKIEKILYLDVKERLPRYEELLKILDDKFKVEENNQEVIFSPLVLFVVNGRVVSYHKGTLFSQESPYDLLDQSQIDGLSEIFKYGIQDVINGMSD